jgi:hypothetical protein
MQSNPNMPQDVQPLTAEALVPPASEPVAVSPVASGSRRRLWQRWRVPAAALVVGLVGGAVTAAALAGDPTQSREYRALKDDMASVQASRDAALDRAEKAREETERARSIAADREAQLDQREASLIAREQTVSATEQQIAANSIEEGIWTVGVDVEPGTYRTSAPVTQTCYWKITRTGSNGSDIVQNDIVQGGYPTVKLREGQDFVNERCGTFVKQ